MDSDTLLLVEDNNDVREVFRMILTAHGYDVTECSDGESAIHQAQQCKHDVAIIDVGLPDMNGYQVAARIRKLEHERAKRPAILVALTGRGGAPSRRQAFEAGFDLHFSKPVEIKTICAEINAMQIAARYNGGSEAA